MERPGNWRSRWSLSNISFKYRLPIRIGTLLATVIVACTWASYRAVKASALDVGRERLQNLTQQLATLLQQSKELGTSLSGALRVFSDEMRHKRMSLAEEKAHALPAKMSVPATVCILPVVLMIAIIPIIVKMTELK